MDDGVSVVDTERICVLLIEDNPGDARLIEEMLAETRDVRFELQLASRLSDGLQRLSSDGRIDAVLLDLSLPDSRGLDTLASVQTCAPGVPVVVLTGLDDEETAMRAVRDGAQDYLAKGQAESSLLARVVRYAIERKQGQEILRQYTHELAAAVEKLQELDQLKNQFIQNVSHELRSPLALIMGYADLLASGELGEIHPQQRRPLETIARQTQVLNDLVEDITLILLAEARPPGREPVALDDLVHTAVDDFRLAAERAGLTLVAEVADSLPPLHGTPAYLRRVVDNLIGNAIKFTPAGGRVTVRLQQQDDHLLLEVTDTGIGIPADEQERIFQRFYQVDGSIRRRYGGAGLGLALVKELVEAHGGRVGVSSAGNQGSTFRVWLPL